MEQKVDRQQIEIRRKLRLQLVDRLVGWLTVICYFLPIVGGLTNDRGLTTLDANLLKSTSALFWVLIFLHSIASLYLYGIPKPRQNLRIVNLYLGLTMFLIIFLDRSFALFPLMERILATLMMIPAFLHSVIGVRLLLQRIFKQQWDKPIPFYLGGNISRDV